MRRSYPVTTQKKKSGFDRFLVVMKNRDDGNSDEANTKIVVRAVDDSENFISLLFSKLPVGPEMRNSDNNTIIDRHSRDGCLRGLRLRRKCEAAGVGWSRFQLGRLVAKGVSHQLPSSCTAQDLNLVKGIEPVPLVT
jgi:hypothetical protein